MQKSTMDRRLCMIAACNILAVLIDKIILVSREAVGAPLALTLFLWYFIFERKKWALALFGILCLLSVAAGGLGVFLLIGYLYRGYDPTPCLLMILVGSSYALSWLALRKEQTR